MGAKLDLFNYATKADLIKTTGAETSKFAKKVDLRLIKLDIDKLKNFPTNLNNLKSKVGKLDVDKLIPILVKLSELSDVVKNDVVKKDAYNAKINNIEDKIADITNVATIVLNTKINEVKSEIPNITNLATTSALAAVENKIPSVSNLVKKTD